MANPCMQQQPQSRGAQLHCRSLVGSLSYLCLPSCAFIFSLRTRSENVIFDCRLLFFQRSYVWSSPGRLKLATCKRLRSTHPLLLGKKRRWRFNCRKRTTQMERSGETMLGVVIGPPWLMTSSKFVPLIVPCLCCSLSVVVEDVSSSACVTVKVFPYMTVAALKQQVRKSVNELVY